MGLNRTWTREEELYLAENWGRMTIPGLAKSLRRSTTAIKIRASRLKLGPVLDSGDYITLSQLIVAVTGTRAGYSYKMKSWVENRGLPVHTKRVEKNTFRVVFLDDWWKWAYENRSFIDFSKMEPLALGEEPPWVKEQRAKDFTAFRIQRKDPWTAYDDSRLIALLKKHQYGYAEMSQMLNRSTGAIQRRCQDLGLRERPVRASNRPERPWDDEAYQILADGIRAGDSYAVIGQRIGKSEKAVRGKVYTAYLTEDADKVRAMMGTGPWGGGAPTPTVKQAIYRTGRSAAVKRDLATIAGILQRRAVAMGWDPFWQRKMCQHWDDFKGCAAGCENCDTCTEFKRIEPQFCSRCGRDFFERAQNRFCPECRTARKKQAQRRWARMTAGR